jgi:hypothetical protein
MDRGLSIGLTIVGKLVCPIKKKISKGNLKVVCAVFSTSGCAVLLDNNVNVHPHSNI